MSVRQLKRPDDSDCADSDGTVADLRCSVFHWILFVIGCVLWTTVSRSDDPISEPGDLSWESVDSLATTQITHELVAQRGQSVERFRLLNAGVPEAVQIRAVISASRLHNDFRASVKLHGTGIGLQLGLLIVFPHQLDPRTGQPLQTLLLGDSLKDAETWQTLNVTATRKAVEAQLRRLRAELNRADLRTQDAMIVGLALLTESSPGESYFDVGPADFGPVIRPPPELLAIAQAAAPRTTAQPQERSFVPIDMELDALLLNGQPVILRLAPDHAEHVATLQQLGLNSVWVPDYGDTERARELFEAGLAVLATPPHPEFEPGDYSTLLHALPPLDRQCPNVSAWLSGTRVSPDELPHLLAWSREIRSADRAYQRLQMADVTGAEGAAAREVDLIGIGRHIVGRDESFGALRNLLVRRRKNAGQLSFPWTWIQTAPSSMQQSWRSQWDAAQPYVEPEQIQQGVYAALSAGYKGVGFWKTRALQIDSPADRETSLAIELSCMEIELLEPFLARGRLEGHLALQTGLTSGRSASGKRDKAQPWLNSALSGSAAGATAVSSESPAGHDAAVVRSDRAVLILATAWDDVSQFVPGPMFEREISMTVAASETASAWQISTSGIRSLPRDVTAGGLSLKIQNFDRCAAIIVSSDIELIRSLEKKIHGMAERSASKVTELASLKYVRVLDTMETLREEHAVPQGADVLMSSARQSLDHAEFELNSKDFHEAALQARDAMRILRQAQQLCWKDAIAEQCSPMASPHTVSFATLPEHWRLMHYLDQQSQRVSDNLLPSGDFENLRSLSQDGWTRDVPQKSVFTATADVILDQTTGSMLRLVAWQADQRAARTIRDDSTPIVVTSPAVQVAPHDVVVVSGRLRKGRTVTAVSNRPLIIFDSELGPEDGLRLELDTDWTSFEMIRPIGSSDRFQVSFELTGQAEVHVDDLQIRKLPAIPTQGPVQFTGEETSVEIAP